MMNTMKRNKELAKKILEYFRESTSTYGYTPVPEIEGYCREEIAYHCFLLAQKGYLNDKPMRSGNTFGQLTWDGHDYLESLEKANIQKREQ